MSVLGSYALKRSQRILQAVADDEWDDVDADSCVALAEAIIAQDAELRTLRLSAQDVEALETLRALITRHDSDYVTLDLRGVNATSALAVLARLLTTTETP